MQYFHGWGLLESCVLSVFGYLLGSSWSGVCAFTVVAHGVDGLLFRKIWCDRFNYSDEFAGIINQILIRII